MKESYRYYTKRYAYYSRHMNIVCVYCSGLTYVASKLQVQMANFHSGR